jgi:hypothetical protein
MSLTTEDFQGPYTATDGAVRTFFEPLLREKAQKMSREEQLKLYSKMSELMYEFHSQNSKDDAYDIVRSVSHYLLEFANPQQRILHAFPLAYIWLKDGMIVKIECSPMLRECSYSALPRLLLNLAEIIAPIAL